MGDAISAAAAAANALREVKHEALGAITAPYTNLRDLHRALTDAIDERGNVLDRASPALGRIRRSLAQAQNDARDRVGAILRSDRYARAIQDNVVTIREGRFVVPVKAEFSGEFPGIVHDTSGSGQTLFVEPLAALDDNNRVRTLRLEEEREVQRVLEELSRSVAGAADAIERNIEMLAQIDLLVAKANVARAMDAIEPELVDDAVVHVEAGRHPLLGDRAIPQTIPLDGATRLLVISGPNMGGKTVALKMVGLFVAMTYTGMHVPRRSRHADRTLYQGHRRRRRRAIDRAQRVDLLRASRPACAKCSTWRTSVRSSSSMKSAAAPSRAREPRSRSRCSSACSKFMPAAS